MASSEELLKFELYVSLSDQYTISHTFSESQNTIKWSCREKLGTEIKEV